MTTRFVDTNVLLRYFTADDEQKAQDVLRLLKRVESGEETVFVSALVIFETVFTLEKYYKIKASEVKDLVQPILNLKGLKTDDKHVFEASLELHAQGKCSFADAFNACSMKKNGISEIYSYDQDFDGMNWLRRVVP